MPNEQDAYTMVAYDRYNTVSNWSPSMRIAKIGAISRLMDYLSTV